MSNETEQPKPAAVTPAAELPTITDYNSLMDDSWVRQEVPDITFELAMYVDGASEFYISMTRGEFVELKKHLAELRGLAT